DIHCAAQAIDTLAGFSEDDPECLELACRVAGWTIQNMQDKSGYFYYREYPMMKARIPMLHWGQATMFKALACLIEKMGGHNSTSANGHERPELKVQDPCLVPQS